MNQTAALQRRGFASRMPLPIGLIGIILLCIPAFINRSPLIFADTRSYFMGGRAAVDKAVGVFSHLFGHAGSSSLDTAVQQARGVRSAYYSLFCYLLTIAGSVWAVIIVQAALSVWLIWQIEKAFLATEGRGRLLQVLVVMTALTTLPWTASLIMPDIFTPLMVLALGCVLIQWPILRRGQRVVLLLLTGVMITFHITNLGLAIGLTLLIAGMQWRAFAGRWVSYVAMSGTILGAVMAMLVVGIVGFKELSIQPQSPPFLTARSLDDGPGKLYLREHCPQLNFVLCRHLDRLDVGADAFIWHDDGVYSAVSSAEQAQMRREDKKLYFLAAAEHPLMQIRAAMSNVVKQLFSFTLQDSRIPSYAEVRDGDMKTTVPESFQGWLVALSVLDYIAVGAACVLCYLLWATGRLSEAAKKLIIVAFAAVILNAFAGAFSMPAPRYQARVVWLLPLMAALFWRPWPLKARVGAPA